MKTCRRFCFSMLCAALATASPGAMAQEGGFDPGWSGSGRRVVDFGSESDSNRYMLIAPNNDVLLAGWCAQASGEAGNVCAARLHSDGSLDPGFGLSGTGMLQLDELGGTQLSYIAGFVRNGDGALWYTGTTANGLQAYVARLGEDGSTLTAALAFHFNTLVAQPNSLVQAMAVAPDNAIYIAGMMRRDSVGNRDTAVARLRYDEGSGAIALDSDFGNAGVARIAFGRGVNKLIVLDDGRVLIAGITNANTGGGLAQGFVMRVLANGTIDDTFGTAAGYTQLPLCASAIGAYDGLDIAVDAQGRIATAYTARYRAPDLTELDSEICVNRLLPDGQQDAGFGGTSVPGGTGRPVRINIGGSQFLESIAVGADGKIIVGGVNVGVGSRCAVSCFMAARLNESPRSNAVLDLSFGSGGAGVSRYDDGVDSSDGSALAIGNGGLMIAGRSYDLFEPYTPPRFGVAKLQLGSAAFDPVFADEFE